MPKASGRTDRHGPRAFSSSFSSFSLVRFRHGHRDILRHSSFFRQLFPRRRISACGAPSETARSYPGRRRLKVTRLRRPWRFVRRIAVFSVRFQGVSLHQKLFDHARRLIGFLLSWGGRGAGSSCPAAWSVAGLLQRQPVRRNEASPNSAICRWGIFVR